MATSPPNASRVRRIGRWIRRLLKVLTITVLAVLLLVVLVLAWATQTRSGRAFVWARLEPILEGSVLAGDLDVGELASVFPSVELRDVQLTEPDGPVMVRASEVRVDYQLLPLLQQHVSLPRIEVVGADVQARILDDGSLNLAGIVKPSERPPPTTEGPGWTVALDEIVVRESRAMLRDARNENARLVIADPLDATVSVHVEPEGLRINVASLAAGVATPVDLESFTPLAIADTEVVLAGTTITARSGEIAVGETSLEGLTADVDLDGAGDAPFAYLDVGIPALRVTPADVNPYLGEGIALLAPLSIEASIEGPAHAVEIALPIEGPAGRIENTLTFDLSDPANPGYRGLVRAVRFVPGEWVSVPVDANVSAGVYLRGQGFNPQTLSARARIDMGPSSFEGIRVDAAHVVAGYDAGTITLPRLAVWSGAASLDASASLETDGTLDARVRLDVPDMAELGARFPDDVPSMAGDIDLDVTVAGRLPLDSLQVEELPETVDEWLALAAGFTADVEVSLDDFEGFDVRAERVRVNAQAEAGGELPDVELSAEVRAIDVAGTRIDRADVATTFDGERLTARGDVSLGYGAQVARFDVAGRLDDDVATIDLRSLTADVADIPISLRAPARVTLWLDETMAPERVRLDDAALSVLDVSLFAGGAFEFDSQRIEARIRATEVNVEPLGTQFAPDLALAGSVDVAIDATGSLSRPTATVAVDATELTALELAPHDVAFTAEFDGQRVLADLELSRNRALILSATTRPQGIPLEVDLSRGHFALAPDAPLSFELSVARLKLGNFGPLLPESVRLATRGYIAGDLGVRGTFDAPEVIASVRVSDATVDVPTEGGEWQVRQANIDLNVRAQGDGDEWTVDGGAELALSDRPIFDIELASDFALSELTSDPMGVLLDTPVETTGVLHEVRVTDLPEWLRAQIGVESGALGGALRWTGAPRTGRGEATFAVSSLTMTGREPVSARVDLSATNTITLDAVAFYGDDAPAISLDGALPERGSHPAAVTLTGSAGASLAELLGQSTPPLQAPLAVRLHVPETEIAELGTAVAFFADEPGTVAGYVDIAGTAGDPQVIGRVAMRDVRLLGDGRGSAAIELRYADASADVDAFVCDAEDRGVELAGGVDVDFGVTALQAGLPPVADWPIRAEIRSREADLGAVVPRVVVAAFLDDLAGVFDADVTVAGTVGRPELDGHMTLTDGRIGVIPLARTFESVQMDIGMSEDALTLRRLDINDERGRVRGEGEVTLRDFRPEAFDLTVRMRDFLASAPSGLGAYLSGDVSVSGTLGDVIDADVVLQDLEIDVPDDVGSSGGPRELPPWIYIEGETVTADQRGARAPELLTEDEMPEAESPLRAHIDVRTEGRGVVRQQIGQVEFVVDLAVDIDGEEVLIVGSVDIPEGTLRVAGKDFTLDEGRVTFREGATVIDPIVDIAAVHTLSSEVTGYLAERGRSPGGERATVSVVVRGSVSDLAADPENAVQLISDPRGLSENDIFQLLATGRLSGDTGEEQQGVAAISSLLLGVLGDQISGGVPIDTLRIESTGESQRVEGGKYIADNVYVSGTYIRSPDDEDDNNFEVALEWILRRIGPGSLRLELRGGDRAKGGLELLYNLIAGD